LVLKKLPIFIVLFFFTFMLSAAFAQSVVQRALPAGEEAVVPSKHRFSGAIGSFMPLGEYPAFSPYNRSTDFEDGGSIGLAYSYKVAENIEIGAYFDANVFDAKEFASGPHKTTIEIATVIIGVSLAAIFPYNERLFLLGGVKAGYASSSQTIETKSPLGDSKKEGDGEALAFSLEATARYKVGVSWDLGLTFGYTYLNQDSDGGDIDLGGISVMISAGYSF
jgi:hypothetical protein